MLTLVLAALLMPLELNPRPAIDRRRHDFAVGLPDLDRDTTRRTHPRHEDLLRALGTLVLRRVRHRRHPPDAAEDVARGWAKIIVFGFTSGSVVMNGKLSRAVMFAILTMALSLKLR